MFRRPEQLLECIEMIYSLIVPRTIEMINASGGFSMSFPLHRGDDTFMSRKQFEKFYWPTLKRYIDALIEEGIQVSLFAEGAYNERLEYIGDFSKGWVSWMFDRTDMARAKKMIGDRCHISRIVHGDRQHPARAADGDRAQLVGQPRRHRSPACRWQSRRYRDIRHSQ